MQRRWAGKSVDLNLLYHCLDDFFTDRKFLTEKSESSGERTILLHSRHAARKFGEPISLRITGNSDDFTVYLKASELAARTVRAGMLTKSLVGGYFLLKGLKLQEELEKLEREFWIYVEDKVAQLAGSARKAQESSS